MRISFAKNLFLINRKNFYYIKRYNTLYKNIKVYKFQFFHFCWCQTKKYGYIHYLQSEVKEIEKINFDHLDSQNDFIYSLHTIFVEAHMNKS